MTTQSIPRVTVLAVTRSEDGSRTVEVDCPACGQRHIHIWPVGQSVVGYRMMACRQGAYNINVPNWTADRRDRTGYAKRNWLDDNAIHCASEQLGGMMSFLDELNQRINQVNSQVGWPAVIGDAAAEQNAIAEKMAAMSFVRLSELDSNPVAQAVAGELLQSVLRPLEFADDIRTDTRWCDESYLRAVVYSVDLDACLWVNLKTPQQWELVATAYDNPEMSCQVHNHPDCQHFNDGEPFTDELKAYAVKRGETIVIFYACATCRKRMDNWDWQADDYVQRGPLPWYDSGPNFEPDPWS